MIKFGTIILWVLVAVSCQKMKQERLMKNELQGSWIWQETNIEFETYNGLYDQHLNNSSPEQWQLEFDGKKINISHSGSDTTYTYSGKFKISQTGAKDNLNYALFIESADGQLINKFIEIEEITDDGKLNLRNFPYNKPVGYSSSSIQKITNYFKKL